MRSRLAVLPALLVILALTLAPGLAFARAGGGFSLGSRGGRTYSAPPGTNTAPYASPFQRSLTPQSPSYAPRVGQAFGGGYGGRSPFVSGLMGGLLGAGIGGLLFGRGMFGGIHGIGGFFGLLLQIFIVVLLVRWLLRRFLARRPAMAGSDGLGGMFARTQGQPGMMPSGGGGQRAISVTQTDYLAFEQLLKMVQAAWSSHDLNTLRQITSPEMASYFAEQLGEQTSRGVRNLVSDVHLDQGDLAEAWAEPGREYATVAMKFSMTDVTRDAAGRVVDGDPSERVQATEVWTFMRAPGGRWILSAIQQAR